MAEKNNPAFEKYLNYLKQVMPHSPWINSRKISPHFHAVFISIQENLILAEINTDDQMFLISESKEVLFNLYKENILSILLAWPTNHPNFISYNIRTTCETLLKLVYAHFFPEKSYDEVSKTSFRHLKEDLKRNTSGIIKDAIVSLCNLYGQFSKQIHGHSADFNNDDLVINGYFEKYFDNVKSYSKAITELTNNYFILNKNLFGFSVENIRVDQRIKISRNLSDEKKLLLS